MLFMPYIESRRILFYLCARESYTTISLEAFTFDISHVILNGTRNSLG